MADEPKFSVTFTGPQLDFVGKFVVDHLNAATAQAKMANEVYQLLRASVQARPAANNGAPAALQVVPEAEVDVSPRSPYP